MHGGGRGGEGSHAWVAFIMWTMAVLNEPAAVQCSDLSPASLHRVDWWFSCASSAQSWITAETTANAHRPLGSDYALNADFLLRTSHQAGRRLPCTHRGFRSPQTHTHHAWFRHTKKSAGKPEATWGGFSAAAAFTKWGEYLKYGIPAMLMISLGWW